MRIQVVIKFQISNFQFLGVTQGKSLRKSHIKSPKNIFLKAIDYQRDIRFRNGYKISRRTAYKDLRVRLFDRVAETHKGVNLPQRTGDCRKEEVCRIS